MWEYTRTWWKKAIENIIIEEINSSLNSGDNCCLSVQNILSSSNFFKNQTPWCKVCIENLTFAKLVKIPAFYEN
jgi:hypothetical protein